MMRRQILKKIIVWLVWSVFFIGTAAYADDNIQPGQATATSLNVAEDNPTAILKKISEGTVRQLRDNLELIEKDPEALKLIIRKEIFPFIDQARMARWALGKHWRRATRDQRIAFAREFETLLLRTYATALLKYIDAEIEFLPVKLVPGDRQAIVRSQVNIESNPQPVAINYRLFLSKNRWRVYDISIEDVSLVASYRTTFSREIRRRGVDSLIDSLHERNTAVDENDKS